MAGAVARNAENESHLIGANGHIVSSCDPADFTAMAEDDPCWLIQSPWSDYVAPWYAIGSADYRTEPTADMLAERDEWLASIADQGYAIITYANE